MPLRFADGTVSDDGYPLLTRVSDEIRAEAGSSHCGLFLVARAKSTSSRHTFALGAIPELARFTVCHRYEPYWMKPKAGTRPSEVPEETQFFLGRLRAGQWLILVPLVGDLFRFSLRGRKDDTLELLAETGDSFAPGDGGLALFVASGSDPFALVREGTEAVAIRLRSGALRRDKPVPDFVDDFGWCTWDAFYQDVSAARIREGLEQFAAGGVRPRLLIVDDGWQSTARRPTGEQRLTSFSANDKFGGDLRPTVRMAKDEFGVRSVLVWHAITGYWGGVDGEQLPGYGVVEQTRQFGEGVLSHVPAFNQLWWGSVFGLVPAEHIARFFDDYHGSLRAQGVDGVKVDSQAVLESVSQRQGGRIALTRAYRAALEGSVAKHFAGRLINCMSNAQETWYGSPRSTLLRSSIDFFPSMPETHGAHLYANAQVGLWFGEFMLLDWDMFQSGHEWGGYHAAARAISGGPVYVSDKPGQHDFDLLRKLVCSDGTVLRCDFAARPTLDSLCEDPTGDGTGLLKVWNRIGAAAVVGVFCARRPAGQSEPPLCIGATGPSDVPEFIADTYACYTHQARTLALLKRDAQLPLALREREYELVTMVPVERGFAAIGLADKLNSAGAIADANWPDARTCELALRDGGDFLAWSERQPASVEVDGRGKQFIYDAHSGELRVAIAEMGRRTLRIAW